MLERLLCVAFLMTSLTSCGILKEKPPEEQGAPLPTKPLPPDKAEELASQVGSDWWFGQGIGETAMQAGGIVVFPPYAIYLLGNAAISLSGYEPVHVTDALPKEDRDEYNSFYNSVTSAPGKLNATVAGKDFVTDEEAQKHINSFLKEEKKREDEHGSDRPHS